MSTSTVHCRWENRWTLATHSLIDLADYSLTSGYNYPSTVGWSMETIRQVNWVGSASE